MAAGESVFGGYQRVGRRGEDARNRHAVAAILELRRGEDVEEFRIELCEGMKTTWL